MKIRGLGVEFQVHYRYKVVVTQACRSFAARLRDEPGACAAHAEDTRPFHRAMFLELCSPGEEDYAGHYRGEDLPNVRDYEVVFGVDRKGVPSQQVPATMAVFSNTAKRQFDILQSAAEKPELAKNLALEVAAGLMVQLLDVHPYVDGNGHIARSLLHAALAQVGFQVSPSQIRDRPGKKSGLGRALEAARGGDYAPLVEVLAEHISRP